MVAPALSALARALPKAELHLHIEGTLEPELLFTLAERNGVPLPFTDVADVTASYDFSDLAGFLAVYYPAMAVLVTADDFYDLTWAYLERAHGDGIVHVEMFFDPQAHTARGVPFGVVVGGIRRAVIRAANEFGMSVELILCFLRDETAEHAMSTLVEALPYRQWIVGVGLDSDERGNPPSKFAAVFARARAEGFLITVHCDIDQPGSIGHIREALEMEVDRLDHGTNILEDPALVEIVRERGIGLTCCPLSNSFVTDRMKSDDILALLRAGVRVTINSDDPAYFGGYLLENYLALLEIAGLGSDHAIALARNSFHAAWLTPARRDEYLRRIDEVVAELEIAA